MKRSRCGLDVWRDEGWTMRFSSSAVIRSLFANKTFRCPSWTHFPQIRSFYDGIGNWPLPRNGNKLHHSIALLKLAQLHHMRCRLPSSRSIVGSLTWWRTYCSFRRIENELVPFVWLFLASLCVERQTMRFLAVHVIPSQPRACFIPGRCTPRILKFLDPSNSPPTTDR